MGQPVMLLVSDQDAVREALSDDLARRLGVEFRILTERSPTALLGTLRRLAEESEELALIIAAQRMREMSGIDCLVRAHALHPAAKRILLIGRRDWAGTSPTVRAMTLGQIDSYLFEPWLPLERWLYLPISQVLADWTPTQTPSFEGIRIIGPQWGSRSHELRDMLTRMGIPHGWYPADSEAGRQLLRDVGEDGSRLPVVVFHSGRVFLDPTNAELAAGLGFGTKPAAATYDVAIIGAGPAGLAAGVYASSEGLSTLVVEPQVVGGQAGTSPLIRNYLGFPRGVSGNDLANRALEQTWLFGAHVILTQHATSLDARGTERVVQLADGTTIAARVVVIATGVSWRRSGIPSLETLVGAGVFYGAAGTEAQAMQGQDVFIVGAGNSAAYAALHLATWAASVTMLVRGRDLGKSISNYLLQQIEGTSNIKLRLHTEIVHGYGDTRLEGLTLRDKDSGSTEDIPATAVFMMIGAEPHTEWLGSNIERDRRGYILTGHDLLDNGKPPPGWPHQRPPLLLETSIPGVFATGDVRHGSIKRVASAVGEGAVAIQLARGYLNEQPIH
jgi:thioredoxin reductase (NADPH)